MNENKKRIAVIGATGYTAHELIRLLASHPQVSLVAVTSESEAGKSLAEYYPDLVSAPELVFQHLSQIDPGGLDLVFLCTPHGESQRIAPLFLENSVRVIDLSGDYRLRTEESYRRWYGQPHSDPEHLNQAAYGLPEMNRDVIPRARLVANPGCYPTGALLALLPLSRAGILAGNRIIIDAKSGVSGAGKKPTPRTHFVEVNENISVYNAGHRHRHIGELEQELEAHTGRCHSVVFTPQLVPINRGILETIYVETDRSTEEVLEILQAAYAEEPFVRIWPGGLPDIHSAAGSNMCHIGAHSESALRTLILAVAFDNLIKGASGQAVQNMNLLFGWDETLGLL